MSKKQELIEELLGEIQNHLASADNNILFARHAHDELIKTLFNDKGELFGEQK